MAVLLGSDNAFDRAFAERLDQEDPLKHLRDQFIIPSKADLKRKTLNKSTHNGDATDTPSIYLCGNSLGLQSHRVAERINVHLAAWATKGVLGHFIDHDDTDIPAFLNIDDAAARKMAPIVGAQETEVAVMETLTANLHLLMASFYLPTKEKYKIIIEGKAFPSDHYAVESQIRYRGFDPKDAMVLIEPADSSVTLSTSHILSVIDLHASSTALILLPGIQYYTGQFLDVKTITAYAHSKAIIIGWDLAHAAGNVELYLHEWDVDFAAWCNYKYINAGPGAVAGLFVHEKHGHVDMTAKDRSEETFRPRLCGWWGGEKSSRFKMGNQFVPIPGAGGFQVGNPSALALTAVLASLEIFAMTDMKSLRTKSVTLTGYLEHLLLHSSWMNQTSNLYRIITPSDPNERGAQLSVLLKPNMLEGVLAELEKDGIVVDERKPDVIRIAPTPLYNTFTDVWDFVQIFQKACEKAGTGQAVEPNGSTMVHGGFDEPDGARSSNSMHSTA